MNALMQSLEARKLFASVTASFVSGKLTVTGTSGGDLIQLNDVALPNGRDGLGVFAGSVDESQPILVVDPSKVKSILIDAGRGIDFINLNKGNYLSSGPSILVKGGDGDDQITDEVSSGATLQGNAGNDTIAGSALGTLDGGAGNDTLLGYSSESPYRPAEHFIGGDGNDTILGNGGADTIEGNAGNDTIFTDNVSDQPGAVSVSIDAGSGNDIVELKQNGTVHLGSGQDILHIEYRDFAGIPRTGIVAYGDADADEMYVSTPPYLADYGNMPVEFHGGGGNDVINAVGSFKIRFKAFGDSGDDSINGSGSADTIYGGDNDDVLIGGYGDNVIYGDAGDDKITGGIHNEKLYGGIGRDTIDGDNGNDLIQGDAGDDKLYGRAGNDTIYGGDNNDVIDGGIGQDSLFGDAGNDDLFGSDGNDTLTGGSGNNRLYGQKGVDTIHSKNGQVDQLFATGGDVLDRDSFDVLKA